MATFTDTGAIILAQPSHIVATLYESGDTNTPSGDQYVLEDVIRDTTTISQDENDTNDIERETSNTPILSIVNVGKFQLAAEIADTQKDLLVALAGFVTDGSKYYAPAQYQRKYIKFDIVFPNPDGSDSYIAYVLPKVQLNSRLMIESLNSNVGRIALAGTARNVSATVDGKTIKVPFWVEPNYTVPTEDD